MLDLLLTNATILAGGDFTPLRGSLGVRGETIAWIGSDLPDEPARRVKDLRGAILLPGLVNAHGHAAMVLLRGAGSDLPLDRWLTEAMFPAEDRLTASAARAGAALAQLEMLAGGTTSYSDMYFFMEGEAEAGLRAGIRMNLSRPVLSFDPSEKPADNIRFRESLALADYAAQTGSDLLKADLSLHAEYTNASEAVAEAVGEEACRRGLGIHVHVSETEKEQRECLERHGQTPLAWLDRLGLTRSRIQAAHCVWITEEDLELMSSRPIFPIHNPASNLKLGSGFAHVSEMLERGIPAALGTDGAASNNRLDMFAEMRLAALLAKGYGRDASLLPVAQVLRMATRNGALSQGRGDTGLLTVGMKADLCAVSVESRNIFPLLDPLDTLVFAAGREDVCLTVVNGRIVYEDGVFPHLDAEKILCDARQAWRELFG